LASEIFGVIPWHAIGHAAGRVTDDVREVLVGFDAVVLEEISTFLLSFTVSGGESGLKSVSVRRSYFNPEPLQLFGGTEEVYSEPLGVAANDVCGRSDLMNGIGPF